MAYTTCAATLWHDRIYLCVLRNPSEGGHLGKISDYEIRALTDAFFVMKALFSILDPQNRVETNTCFVFAHDFVLASRYLHFFPLLTYITDSKKFLRCLLFMDGRSQLQHSDTSTKSVKRRMLKLLKWRGKINVKVD